MMSFDDVVTAIRVTWKALQSFEGAGTLGALLSLRWAPGKTFFDRLFAIGGGLGMAFYVGPFIMERMEVKSSNGLMAGGFLLGTLGALLIVRGVAAVRELDTGRLIDILSRIKGK
jgi:hypothetical protein